MAERMEQTSPFSDGEAAILGTPVEVARVARDFAVFSFRLFEAATNGHLTPAIFGKTVGVDTGRLQLVIEEEYTPLEVRKWAWNSWLAGVAASTQAMDRALDDTFGVKPLARHPVPSAASLGDLDAARVILYMFRNAFAHDPFNPRWQCKGPYCATFRVHSLGLELDAAALDGAFISAGDLGGLDGYWNLLQFCFTSISEEHRRRSA